MKDLEINMDRFENRLMCCIPSIQDSQMVKSEFTLNQEIKQEIPDIDFEDEKFEDPTAYDDGFHSKCGEIYINNINREFSLYCCLCNANFINFNIFSHHILYGKHGNQLIFLDKNCSNANMYDEKKIDGLGFVQNNSNAEQERDNPVFHECNICLETFHSNEELQSHSKLKHFDIVPNEITEKNFESNQIDKIVSVATFSLAICNEKNDLYSNRKKHFKEYLEKEQDQSVKDFKYKTVSLHSTMKSIESYASEENCYKNGCNTKSSNIFSSFSSEMYSSAQKHINSTKFPDSSKETGPILKASTTIAEISSTNVSTENDLNIISDQISRHCPYCPNNFKNIRDLNYHLQKHHSKNLSNSETIVLRSENRFECELCKIKFRREHFYKNHMKNHSQYELKPKTENKLASSFNNPINQKKYNRTDESKEHINSEKYSNMHSKYQRKKKLKCQHCGKTVSKLNHLILHERKHKLTNSVKCRVCDKKFYLQSAFENHMTRYHHDFQYELTYEEIQQLSKTRQPNVKSKDEKLVCFPMIENNVKHIYPPKGNSCKYCLKIFKTVEYRILHEKAHIKKESISCEFCEQKFNSKITLSLHKQECSKRINVPIIEIKEARNKPEINRKEKDQNDYNPSNLNSKLSINTKSKFMCSHCNIVLSSKNEWDDHIRKHICENIDCNICDYEAMNPFYLKSNTTKIHDHQTDLHHNRTNFLDPSFETISRTSRIKKEYNKSLVQLKIFKCKFCGESFKKKTKLELHLTQHLRSKQISSFDIFKCKYCHFHYKTKFQVLLHERKHRKEKLFECSSCDRKFSNKGFLGYHKKIQHNIGPQIKLRCVAKCKFCDKVFKRLKYLRNHVRTVHINLNINKIECKFCKQLFCTHELLTLHIKNQHDHSDKSINEVKNLNKLHNISTKTKKIPEKIKGNWINKEHEKMKNNEKKFICDICDRAFRFKKNLLRHSLLDHFKNKKSCYINNQLGETERIHSVKYQTIKEMKNSSMEDNMKKKSVPSVGGTPFECPYDKCHKSFRRRMELYKHHLIHLEKFKCKYCSKIFSTTEELQNHGKSHLEKLRYRCKLCLKNFGIKQELILHKCRINCAETEETKSNVSNDSELCSKSFCTKTNLTLNETQKVFPKACDIIEKNLYSNFLKSTYNFNLDNMTENELKCDKCCKKFLNSKSLLMHYKKGKCAEESGSKNCISTSNINDSLKETISTSDVESLSKTLSHDFVHSKMPLKPENICKLCLKDFDTESMLYLHTQRRACEVPTEFLYDNKLEQNNLLNNELIFHNNKNQSSFQIIATESLSTKREQYKCDVCFKNFMVKGFLLRHMKYYHPSPDIELYSKTGEKGNESKTKNNLNFLNPVNEESPHRRSTRRKIESEDTKLQCQICLKKFETKGLLAGHTRTKACFKSSSCMSTLRAQRSPPKDGNETAFKCKLCNKVFANEGNLTNHIRNQICVIKKNIQKIDDNNMNVEKLISVEENEQNIEKELYFENDNINKNLINKEIDLVMRSINVENDVVFYKKFVCKRCQKIFKTKVSLAWHTRRKECITDLKKNKSIYSLTERARKIRKKLVNGIIRSNKIKANRKILQKKIQNTASLNVSDKVDKYVRANAVITKTKYTKVFPKQSEIFDKYCEDNLAIGDNLESLVVNSEMNEAEQINKKYDSEENKVKLNEINLTCKTIPNFEFKNLHKEKDTTMIRAIRNYIKDRQKGRKLPQRFYCDRYNIKKIHFYRKLFKLGLVKKKGPRKKDLDNIELSQKQNLISNFTNYKSDSEHKKTENEAALKDFDTLRSSSTKTVSKKLRKGRTPKCSEEIVRSAVMEYRMGKGTQVQICEKYKIGICAFHRIKKIMQNEMPNLRFPNEILDRKTDESLNNFEDNNISSIKAPSYNLSNNNNLGDSNVNTNECKDTLKRNGSHKLRRKMKIMKTGDQKKRRLAITKVCGDLIVNRKSKYNISGTKENVLLMDAISDVVNGTRSFSCAVKHYKISFYTLQRYVKKFKEKFLKKEITEKSNETIELAKSILIPQESSVAVIGTSEEPGTNNLTLDELHHEDLKNKDETKIVCNVTGQLIVRKKFQGRGGKGKIRQTVYSKPGTKENKVLMKAIREIKNKGKSICNVSKKFQISIQTISKYITIFEKQGILPKDGKNPKHKKCYDKTILTPNEKLSIDTRTEGNLKNNLSSTEFDKNKQKFDKRHLAVNENFIECQNPEDLSENNMSTKNEEIENEIRQKNQASITTKECENNQKNKNETKNKIEIRKPTYLTQRASSVILLPEQRSSLLKPAEPFEKLAINTDVIEIKSNSKESNESSVSKSQVSSLQAHNFLSSAKLSISTKVFDSSDVENKEDKLNISSILIEQVTQIANEFDSKIIKSTETKKEFSKVKYERPILPECVTENLRKPSVENVDSFKSGHIPITKNISISDSSYLCKKKNQLASIETKKNFEISEPVLLNKFSRCELQKPSEKKNSLPTKCLSAETNDDDLLMEHAMCSLLEQDAELDLAKTNLQPVTKKDNFGSSLSCTNINIETNTKSLTTFREKTNKPLEKQTLIFDDNTDFELS